MNKSLEDEIKKYKELLKKQMISQDEFEIIKERIIKKFQSKKIII